MILLAMGYSDKAALGGIRITLGRDTTEADIDWTVMVLKQVLQRLTPDFSGQPKCISKMVLAYLTC
jgi:cysteine desulfurase